MLRVFLISLTLVAIYITACGSDNVSTLSDKQEQSGETDKDKQDENAMETNSLKLSVNGRSFTATMTESSSTEALKERLAQGDVSIRMSDYGNMEKVGNLGFSLPRNDIQTTTVPGDIVLYQGNSLVIFYGANSWSYTRLGKVDGVSTRKEMLELLGGAGEITVTLSLN